MANPRIIKLQRDLASVVYRAPIPMVEMLNNHARLRKWLSTQNAPTFKHRFSLYEHVSREYIGDEAINYLEFGVFKGESFARWMQLNSHAESRFYGFDTFTGLPTDWGSHLKRGHFGVEGQVPSIADPRGKFIKGLFQESLPPFLKTFEAPQRRLVIHNDSDLYSSTIYTLASLNDLIVPGTILIFDEFASPMHEFRAWNDFTEAFMRKAELIGYTVPHAIQAAFQFQ